MCKRERENRPPDSSEYLSDPPKEACPLSVHKVIQSKVYKGDLRGAVGVLVSDGSVAEKGEATLSSHKNKHPTPFRHLFLSPIPDSSYFIISYHIHHTVLYVNVKDVLNALKAFYSGSTYGPESGLNTLKKLCSPSAEDNGPQFARSYV
ncbi:hypothetical protein EVAR_28965_1 [Eumeta japonica]|uniref:Uncharacterized protein n=1 Tax=Eumeta variegata TaxID=151549 RepID=A0A4C1VZV4_EUMVA|nr:hypothetical protein EVAR_28965_1 [Eumeta japonica]